MNVKKPNNFATKTTLCSSCNSYVNLDDFFQHKEKCSSFKQTFKSKQSNERDSTRINSNINFITSANPFFKPDSNLNTFGSKKKNQEENYDDAAVTFGARNSKKLVEELKNSIANNFNDYYSSENQSNLNNVNVYKKNNLNVGNSNSTNENPVNYGITLGSSREEDERKKYQTGSDNNKSFQCVGIINKLGDHNSFLSVIIQAFYSMQKLRNFILNEMIISETDFKNSLLLNLQNAIKKIHAGNSGSNKKYNQSTEGISIYDLRRCLSDNFQSRRKFLIEYPDDPIDVYYALINAFHSYHIKSNLSELKDASCDMKCLSHKFFYLDLYSIEECECNGVYKRLYSCHNYVFDLPLDKILKIAEGNSAQIAPTPVNKMISDLKGKLFFYFKSLLNQMKLNCPEKGIRCSINKTTKILYLSNVPTYLAFNMQSNNINYSHKHILEILKIFIMIPKVFELSNVFLPQDKNKYYYELLGAVCLGPNKNYTSFFKNSSYSSIWNHYDDEKVSNFSNYADLISHCLKYNELPILVFFQLGDKINEKDKDLTLEDISKFERFCKNLDNLNFIVQNKYRPNEDIIKYTDEDEENQNKFRRTIEKERMDNKSTSTNTNSRQNSNNFYDCFFCGYKNKIEEKNNICVKCNKSNEKIVDDIKRKGYRNEERKLNKSNSKNNLRDDKNSSLKNEKTIQTVNSKSNIEFSQDDKTRSMSKDKYLISESNDTSNPPRLSYINKETTQNFFKNEENLIAGNFPKKPSDKIKNEKNDYNLPKQIKDNTTNVQPNNLKPYKNNNIKIVDDFLEKEVKRDEWNCQLCGSYYKLNENKCLNCLKKNVSIESNDRNKPGNIRAGSKGPEISTKYLDKNYGSFIQTSTINLNNNPTINLTTAYNPKNTKNDFYKDKDEKSNELPCVCSKLEDDKVHTLFNNNVCRICGRNKAEKSIKTETNYTSGNLRKSTEQSSTQSGVAKSSILTDLNKRLSALKSKDDKLVNNYVSNNNKPSIGIKTENVKYIGDKNFNLDRKKPIENQHINRNIENIRNQFISNNTKESVMKRDVRIDVGAKPNISNQKFIPSPSKNKLGNFNSGQGNNREIYSKYKK